LEENDITFEEELGNKLTCLKDNRKDIKKFCYIMEIIIIFTSICIFLIIFLILGLKIDLIPILATFVGIIFPLVGLYLHIIRQKKVSILIINKNYQKIYYFLF